MVVGLAGTVGGEQRGRTAWLVEASEVHNGSPHIHKGTHIHRHASKTPFKFKSVYSYRVETLTLISLWEDGKAMLCGACGVCLRCGVCGAGGAARCGAERHADAPHGGHVLGELQLQLINRRSSKTKPTAHPKGATQLYQVVR